jgi:hypothetical protein
MNLRAVIIDHMTAIAASAGSAIAPDLDDGTVLLRCGLDSLGFATLVARLEDALGYDPFTLMEQPVYPRTFGEFVAIYERHAPR